jgi:hypothetical protein
MGKSIDNFQPQMHVLEEEVDGPGTETFVYNYGKIWEDFEVQGFGP